MVIGTFGYYLIIINVVGFACIIAAILIFDRKAEKGNMMSRIFVACIFVIQIIILLIIKGHLADNITLAFWKFLDSHRIGHADEKLDCVMPDML